MIEDLRERWGRKGHRLNMPGLPPGECDRCNDDGDGGICTCCGLLHAPRVIVVVPPPTLSEQLTLGLDDRIPGEWAPPAPPARSYQDVKPKAIYL